MSARRDGALWPQGDARMARPPAGAGAGVNAPSRAPSIESGARGGAAASSSDVGRRAAIAANGPTRTTSTNDAGRARARGRSREGCDVAMEDIDVDASKDAERASARDGDASGSDDDDEAGEDADADGCDADAAPKRLNVVKAPRLEQDAIDLLSFKERKLVSGRWTARLRGSKHRLDDIASQFPTSSVVLLFTKPFQSKRRHGKWIEDEFMVRGPIRSAPSANEGEDALTGGQLLRQLIARLLHLTMDEGEVALDHGVIDERETIHAQPHALCDVDVRASFVEASSMRRRNAKAPKLTQGDIDKLDDYAKKLALGRWNSRVRALRRKIDDCADQFPTSSIVLLFTKPFQQPRLQLGRWAEEEFIIRGPIRSALSVHEGEETLTGGQLLRRLIARLLHLTMDERALALDRAIVPAVAPPTTAVTPPQTETVADVREVDTLEGMFGLLKSIVAPDLHAKCAHILTQSTVLKRTKSAKERTIVALAEKA